jgi:hypothetical protein
MTVEQSLECMDAHGPGAARARRRGDRWHFLGPSDQIGKSDSVFSLDNLRRLARFSPPADGKHAGIYNIFHRFPDLIRCRAKSLKTIVDSLS